MSTGGGNHVYAPAMHWVDRDRLLIAAPPKREGQDGIVIAHDKWLTELFEVNVKTGEVRTVCKLPFPGFSMMTRFDPDFWRRSDNALMMRSKQFGDHRIEVRDGKSVSDRHLSTQYEFRGDIYKPQLWAGDDQLAAKVNVWDVSVSPDGRQIVWMVPVQQNQYGWTHAEKSFFFHSEKTGTVKIEQGRFDLAKSRPTHPVQYRPVLWLTDEDLLVPK